MKRLWQFIVARVNTHALSAEGPGAISFEGCIVEAHSEQAAYNLGADTLKPKARDGEVLNDWVMPIPSLTPEPQELKDFEDHRNQPQSLDKFKARVSRIHPDHMHSVEVFQKTGVPTGMVMCIRPVVRGKSGEENPMAVHPDDGHVIWHTRMMLVGDTFCLVHNP